AIDGIANAHNANAATKSNPLFFENFFMTNNSLVNPDNTPRQMVQPQSNADLREYYAPGTVQDIRLSVDATGGKSVPSANVVLGSPRGRPQHQDINLRLRLVGDRDRVLSVADSASHSDRRSGTQRRV